jgi:asparagine synthase (glutamine-hydrolysing)
MIYNGEIYNFVELRRELEGLGHTFASSGDTEVLLAAYAEWGEACLSRLNGMFAFAIWDARRRRLFGARDRFGEKPLHYVFDERRGVFAFASEIKALLALGVASGRLNDRALYRYFRFGEQAGAEATIWDEIHRLPPATGFSLEIREDGLTMRRWRYWDVDFETALDREPMSHGDAERAFRELFADSVRIRLRSDVPVGTSLSGGLDSSSVLCQIGAIGAAAGQKAFTARMDDPRLDEGPYVDQLLALVGIPGFSVTPTAQEFMREIDRLYYHQEEPFPATSIFSSYMVNRLALQHGVTVLLDGQGADEYLAGYAHYPATRLMDLARRWRLRGWARERRETRQRLGTDPVPPKAMLVLAAQALRGEGREILVDDLHDVQWLHPEFRAAHAHEAPRTIPAGRDALRARLKADLTLGHLQELLRYADRNAMAFSREPRLPFLDHRLVELCASLPTEYLLEGGESKKVMRAAMRGIVPDVILDRKDKVGFATPWANWWRGDCAAALERRLRDSAELLRDYVDPQRLRPGSREALIVVSLASAVQSLTAEVGASVVS